MAKDDIDSVPKGLQRLCMAMRVGAALGGVVTLVLPPWFWSRPEWVAAVGGQMAGLGCQPIAVDGTARLWGGVVSVVPVVLGLALFVLLWRLFGEYAQGRALRAPAQRHLQGVAWLLLALALLQPLTRAAMSAVLTMNQPPGQRLLVLQLSGNDYLALLTAVALLAVAMVMRQAVQAAEENRGFV